MLRSANDVHISHHRSLEPFNVPQLDQHNGRTDLAMVLSDPRNSILFLLTRPVRRTDNSSETHRTYKSPTVLHLYRRYFCRIWSNSAVFSRQFSAIRRGSVPRCNASNAAWFTRRSVIFSSLKSFGYSLCNADASSIPISVASRVLRSIRTMLTP